MDMEAVKDHLPHPKHKIQKQNWVIFFFFLSIGIGVLFTTISLQNDLSNLDFSAILNASQTWLANWPMMVVAIMMLVTIMVTSGIRYQLLLRKAKSEVRFRESLMFGILARYYVLITPWALGSQPILIGLLYQRKYSIGQATNAVMLDLLMMRLSMAMIVAVALLGFSHLVSPVIITIAWIGFFLTCVFPILLVLGSVQPWLEKLVKSLIHFAFPKKHPKMIQSIEHSLTQYRQAFKEYRQHKQGMFFVFLFALISQIAMLSIPYFLLASFSQDIFNPQFGLFTFWNLVMMMAIANVIIGVAPTLGSAGAAELTFATFFSIFLSGNFMFWAILLWRGMLFYVWLIIGILMSLSLSLTQKKSKKKAQKLDLKFPLKVFIFNDGFFPMIDGVVRAVDGYAKYLVSKGIDVTVVVPFNGDTKPFPYQVIAIPQYKIPGFFYPVPYGVNRKKIWKKLQYDGPTIYHAHTPFLLGHLALRLSKRFQVPLVTTFHSKYFDDYYAATKNRLVSNILKYFTINYFRKSNAIWTVSDATVKTIHAYGLTDRPIKVISNGVDIKPNPWIGKEKEKVLKTYGIQSGVPILLFVGQLIWQKNLKLIIDTYSCLEKKGFTFQAMFVGDGRHQDDIKAYAKDLNLQSNIIFTGQIKDYQVLSTIYALSHLFFFPSAYDNDPLVIKEAAAHGLPSLVLANTSVSTLIHHDDNGFIQDGDANLFAERIINIFLNQQKRTLVGLNAKATLVKGWNETLLSLIPSYASVIDDYYST